MILNALKFILLKKQTKMKKIIKCFTIASEVNLSIKKGYKQVENVLNIFIFILNFILSALIYIYWKTKTKIKNKNIILFQKQCCILY